MASAAECRARRERLASEFRAALIEQLGGAPETVVKAALISACVSAHVEIQELSALFLRAKASSAQQRQLALARGQLSRLLAGLGLCKPATEPATVAPVDTLTAWIARQNGSEPTPHQPPIAPDAKAE
jgi:hypothetical protein